MRSTGGAQRVAMEVSPGCAIPYVSRVDAGTVEFVRSLGLEVVTSADLVQVAEAVWTAGQLASHRRRSQALLEIQGRDVRSCARAPCRREPVTECGIQDFMMREFAGTGWRQTIRPSSA